MSKHGDEKLWVVVVNTDDGSPNVSVYDNESDANNYFIEMQAMSGNTGIHIQQTTLNRRDGSLPYIDAPWGVLRMDLKSEFVEGLMEDMVPPDEIKPGAAEQLVGDLTEVVGRRMLKRVGGIIRDETKEELKIHDEWHFYEDMED
ncbi:MAG: hypothetical protein LBQ42_07020 [Synergistaceae bacterium]|jgi:hypothetical protein|nr:hypothetical protein [Synergistaceae bacterium]